MWSLLCGAALAEPPHHAVAIEAAATTTEASGAAAYRVIGGGRAPWLGVTARGARVTESYLDGWRVDRGTKLDATVDGDLPLLVSPALRIDLRASAGLRSLRSDAPLPAGDRSRIALTEIGPTALLRASNAVGARLGWTQLTHLQLTPGFATDTLGQLLVGGLVVAPTDDLQLTLRTEVGGVFGYDGDGGKAVTRAAVGVVWVPGAARTLLHAH